MTEKKTLSPELIETLRGVDTPTLSNAIEAFKVRELVTGFTGHRMRYCQMLWMKVVCPWRDGAAEESVSGRPWLISMRLF